VPADPQISVHYDVVVIGAGPAGISAAINIANRKRSVLVLDSQSPFSKAGKAPAVPNYPGFTFATGEQLGEAFLEHLERFEVPLVREKASKIMAEDDEFLVFTDREMYRAKAVVLATGVHRLTDLEGEDALVGRGVSYCANCDGRLFGGREVVYIAYTADGEEEASVLAEELGVTVTYLPLYAGEPSLPESVKVLPRERPDRLYSTDGKVAVQLKSGPLLVDGVFVHKPSVAPGDLVEGIVVDGGHVTVDRQMATAVPGVFAAGDATGEPYQIAKAVGEGQVAALHALRYLRESARPPASEELAVPAEPPVAEEPPALAAADRENLARILGEKLVSPVSIVHFGQTPSVDGVPIPACDACHDALRLVQEFAALSDKLTLVVHDYRTRSAEAESMGVTRIPATLLKAADGSVARVRFFGTPSGYEFGTFLDAVLALSTGVVRLDPSTVEALSALTTPVHIEVLTTPTCPRCPELVRLAHLFAMAGPSVTADMVNVVDFPEVARLHNVLSVPRLVLNGVPVVDDSAEGPLTQERLLRLVTDAAKV